MSTPKLPRPPGHNTLTPTTISLGAKKVIAFLEKVFGGKVVDIYEMPDGNIAHSEVMIDGSIVMIADPMPGWPAMPAAITVYVEDGPAVDAAYARAIDAGATSVKAPKDEFYGHRSVRVGVMLGAEQRRLLQHAEPIARDLRSSEQRRARLEQTRTQRRRPDHAAHLAMEGVELATRLG